ncbi:miniconductance mechanosensitive channel [Sphingobacterium nematocida]|uniref:Miniconductance mechanosensitive channel n=1 Tax=Sphingobacterium nematocida TaxID=1513896 RepID=A0A1T5F539_9SPHI|nr:mechanosensitive ion channel domain-containing protein [Sphingobacterium nematocida]SKB91138.1 miniconductance mechanosensitive channel [Sphingobacterium nematocida]
MKNLDLLNFNEQYSSSVYQYIFDLFDQIGLSVQQTHIITAGSLFVTSILCLVIIDYVLRKFLYTALNKIVKKTSNEWDDFVLQNKVHIHISRILITIISRQVLLFIFLGFPLLASSLEKLLNLLIILAIYSLSNSLLKTCRDILRSSKAFKDKPIDSYLQVIQIFLIFILGTLVISLLTGNSPWSFLVSLGAASAILMLVFKDTILGFVASIQVSANDSVRVGDWIEMPKYGVDGDVLQINLNNVKIQNWDKTIVTIPTYTLLSDSFKNYRGMQETGGRRIKRALNIKISSIRYLNEDEIIALKKIKLLEPYINQREQEIAAYNKQWNTDISSPVNGRRMTNIGLFRAYVLAHAKHNPNIHQELTLLVRQLAPTEYGLPLELYMFTKGTQWSYFENTMADIFDHLLAAIKFFKLEIFELPASDDLRLLMVQQKKV